MEVILEFGKILIPSSILLYAVYLIIRSFITKEIEMKRLEIRGKSIETVLPIRMQAYERMTLFLERMAPQNLLVRLGTPSCSAKDFRKIVLDEIRNEYNHNVSQQIYMSEKVWEMIKSSKENLIHCIEEASSDMWEGATSVDLSAQILQTLLSTKTEPMVGALSELKKEIQQTF